MNRREATLRACDSHTALELLDVAESALERADSYGDGAMARELCRIRARLKRQRSRMLDRMDKALNVAQAECVHAINRESGGKR